ncbi:MAG: prolyl-tRNA synthetase associated domain-containing protein [Candidatus Adiutrix sp.]|jgi:Ala-tRNA(Pro) deacylase|nr:prolyl-tRNA synthetase associated domain-containing protein [Candidatus Adiutrix sp.]
MEARQKVYQHLDELRIDYQVSDHPPVYTVEEMERLELDRLGGIVKNLFLRDAKGRRHFLVLMRHDKKVDLKALGGKIGSTALRFASPERLRKHLGLESGAVGPFGLLNDRERAVEVVLDEDLKVFPRLGVHPNDNTATVWLSFADLDSIVRRQGNPITHLRI